MFVGDSRGKDWHDMFNSKEILRSDNMFSVKDHSLRVRGAIRKEEAGQWLEQSQDKSEISSSVACCATVVSAASLQTGPNVVIYPPLV